MDWTKTDYIKAIAAMLDKCEDMMMIDLVYRILDKALFGEYREELKKSRAASGIE